MNLEEYKKHTAATRSERMRWWHDARFGMFVHWGLYSQLGRHEWVMNRERIPIAEYEKLADTWQPKERPAREWARLAKQAGMKYMVMTTKHHEGFCLWDTAQTDYNAVKSGPKRDLVREYVEACREFDLKIGFYYSLMDWHHPDGANCAKDEAARRRFLDFTQGCVCELCSNYGKIDILWYDVSWPLENAERWESLEMNQMAHQLQPGIIINNRSWLAEDFGTPEEHVTAEKEGRAWEACMTMNDSWGYKSFDQNWKSSTTLIRDLVDIAGKGGNFLLNVGPTSEGLIPEPSVERLAEIGKWMELNGESIYGTSAGPFPNLPWGRSTQKPGKIFVHVFDWPQGELVIPGMSQKVEKAFLLADPRQRPLDFTATGTDLLVKLPAQAPDPAASVVVLVIG